jgi:hypothetical protein
MTPCQTNGNNRIADGGHRGVEIAQHLTPRAGDGTSHG